MAATMADRPAHSQQYIKWKMGIPFLYDWFANHNLTWPSLSCRWGQTIDDSAFKRKQYVYLSERTDMSEPNKLMLVPVELCKPRVAAAESISGFHEKGKSGFVKPPAKTILHQGEVNKIRELPSNPNIVATHSDASEVYIWHFDRQTHRGDKKSDWKKLSEPDLMLDGHRDIAEFALATSAAEPVVASGGRDTNVLLWNLKDFDGGSLLESQSRSSPAKPPRLAPNAVLKGHKKTIGDVAFQPKSANQLASVGDDQALLLWDTRAGTGPAAVVSSAHKEEELRCVDWSAQDINLVATGAEDGSMRVWDRRRLSSPLHTFGLHTKSLIRLEWSSYRPGLLASGGEDGIVCIWDLNRKALSGQGEATEGVKARQSLPAELLFQHAGHQAGQIADFQWHPTDPFTMISVSDDPEGGTLQLWRVNDLIYRPEAEVLTELEQFRDDIVPKDRVGSRAEAYLSEGGKETPELSPKPEAAPPISTGGGSAPAATPAGAFVGVPEGVPVSAAEERPMEVDEPAQ